MKAETKILGPSVGYTDLLDYEISEKLKKEDEERVAGTKRYSPLRPSSAGQCSRRLAYEVNEFRNKATYVKEVKNPQTYRLLQLGNAIEYQALRDFALVKVLEQKYKQQILTFFPLERGEADLPKEMVEGSCDVVFWSEKHRAIADVKSKKDKHSKAYKTDWDETLERLSSLPSLLKLSETAFYAPSLPAFLTDLNDVFFADNFYQLNMYACNPFIKERGIDHAFIYRYNKNTSQHLEIRFAPSESLYEEIKAKFNAVSVAVDLDKIEDVPRDYNLGSMRCAFCPFMKQCWGEDTDALKAWFKTFPGKKWPENLNEKHILIPMFQMVNEGNKLSQRLDTLKENIIKQMIVEKLQKVRLPNGDIYELKHLKSPRPHYDLRRGKA